MLSIVCEINPHSGGIRRNVADGFAKDREGEIWVVHRGRFNITGGMTTEFYRKRYSKPWVAIGDDNKTSKVIPVGRLVAEDFGMGVHDLIFEVDRIKEIGTDVNRS